jgi:peptide/bleomycin uptake transporter
MLKSFFLSKEYGPYAWFVGGIILFTLWYGVEILVFYNKWNREMMDSIQSLQEERFWMLFLGWDAERLYQLYTLRENTIPSFIEILATYVPITTYGVWQTQRYVFKWRQANTHYYLKRWEGCDAKIEGSSQRIQEDLMVYGKTLQGLIAGIVTKVLVLVAFLPILWELSEGLPIWNGEFVPGFLVWVALTMSLGGTFVSVILGWKLPSLEYANQVVEARFRKRLVHSEDDFAQRAVADLFPMFEAVRKNYYRLFNWYMGFSVWQQAFGFVIGNLALLALAPSYFQQLITMGVLFQVLNAFGRVESSMTFFIDRWPTIVDFLSVIKRIREFDRALTESESK